MMQILTLLILGLTVPAVGLASGALPAPVAEFLPVYLATGIVFVVGLIAAVSGRGTAPRDARAYPLLSLVAAGVLVAVAFATASFVRGGTLMWVSAFLLSCFVAYLVYTAQKAKPNPAS